MIGHKTSLKILIHELKKEDIKYITHTEFCQGRTTRWGLAWSFKENLLLHKHVPPRCESRKKNVGMTFVVPSTVGTDYNTVEITKKLKCILDSLRIDIQVLEKRSSLVNIELKAYENTWSNQRRKRRLTKRRHSVVDDSSNQAEQFPKIDSNQAEQFPNINHCTANVVLKHNDPHNTKCLNNNNIMCETQTGESSRTNTPILHCLLNIRKSDENVLMELMYVSGEAGKDGMHQILQYIKNNFK